MTSFKFLFINPGRQTCVIICSGRCLTKKIYTFCHFLSMLVRVGLSLADKNVCFESLAGPCRIKKENKTNKNIIELVDKRDWHCKMIASGNFRIYCTRNADIISNYSQYFGSLNLELLSEAFVHAILKGGGISLCHILHKEASVRKSEKYGHESTVCWCMRSSEGWKPL